MGKFSSTNQPAKANRFSSTNQPANRGRKPKFFKRLRKAYSIERPEFEAICQHLLCCTKEELREIMEHETTPILVINIARAIFMDTQAGRINTVKDLCNMFWGGRAQGAGAAAGGESGDESPRIEIEIVDRRAMAEAQVLELKEGNDGQDTDQ